MAKNTKRSAIGENLVLLRKERGYKQEQVADMLLHEYQYFYVATNENGSVFRLFDVTHVPYAVIVNAKGIIVWAGNPLTLTDKTIEKILQQ